MAGIIFMLITYIIATSMVLSGMRDLFRKYRSDVIDAQCVSIDNGWFRVGKITIASKRTYEFVLDGEKHSVNDKHFLNSNIKPGESDKAYADPINPKDFMTETSCKLAFIPIVVGLSMMAIIAIVLL